MRKNGFTLIELLAVIVILAIIALIATPIILGIINDAREKANERSIELYASAIRNGIAAYQLTSPNAPASFSDLTVQYDGDVKCTVQELYEDGSFYLEGCKVNNGEKEYSYGTKQGSTYEGTMNICNPLNVRTEGVYTAGDKYECDVDPNKEGYDYIFYVLTSAVEGSTSVNLIMDSNINKSGEAVKESVADKGFVAWILEEDYPGSNWGDWEDENTYGPITAMNHLQTATAGWTNTNELTINTFTDDAGETHEMAEYVVNARMPYYSEISDYDGSNAYLYDNLNADCYDDDYEDYVSCDVSANIDGVHEEGMTHVSGVYGYWMLSAYDASSDNAWYAYYSGTLYNDFVNLDAEYGVRPVINLSI